MSRKNKEGTIVKEKLQWEQEGGMLDHTLHLKEEMTKILSGGARIENISRVSEILGNPITEEEIRKTLDTTPPELKP